MLTDFLRSSTIVGLVLAFSINASGNKVGGQHASYETELTHILESIIEESGLVNYSMLRGSLNESFNEVLRHIEMFDGPLAGPLVDDDQKKAFWINAYNVHMLNNIVQNPSVVNIIRDGYGDAFFKTPVIVAGHSISLDDIENRILRRDNSGPFDSLAVEYLDPRIHVALNCAAISCPQLIPEALTPSNMDALLDLAFENFVNSQNHFRVSHAGIIVSSLLDWFGQDFEQDGTKAGDYIVDRMSDDRPGSKYLKDALRGRTADEIRNDPYISFEYWWLVNDLDRD